MFKEILVPLDGSRLAEVALPVAIHLAQQLEASITLLHVVEANPPAKVHGQPHLVTANDAQAYLKKLTYNTVPHSMQVQQHVHVDPARDVAESIVAHASELQIDLIVMCSHGGNNLHRSLFGSIAQQVIRLDQTPLLLVNEKVAAPTFNCRRLLVTLDGDPAHEQGLTAAYQLAQQCQAEIGLVMVIPTPPTLQPPQSVTGRLLPYATTALLDLQEPHALEYLLSKRSTFTDPDSLVLCDVQRGEPATMILETASKINADLIVLATHGTTHLDAFGSSSVTSKLIAQAYLPLLLVPVVNP